MRTLERLGISFHLWSIVTLSATFFVVIPMPIIRSPDLAEAPAEAPAEASWERQTLPIICSFLDLPDNWDSYGGRALKLETGMFALKVLNEIMDARSPIPYVVPIATGGVQLEWHENDFDLELTITAPYDCELWYQDHRSGASGSIALSADLSALTTQMARLTQTAPLNARRSRKNP